MNYDSNKAPDKNFSSILESKSVQQQLFSAKKKKAKNNSFDALKGLSGLLKDEISQEQFEEMLKDTHL